MQRRGRDVCLAFDSRSYLISCSGLFLAMNGPLGRWREGLLTDQLRHLSRYVVGQFLSDLDHACRRPFHRCFRPWRSPAL